MGTFQIIENKSDAVKFRGMVSFNGKPAEYYEVDLDVVDRAVVDLQKEQSVATELRATEIDQEIAAIQASSASATGYVLAQLQKVADQDATPPAADIQNELQVIA